jgi:very-short-patch-repair endonuclease
MRSDGLRRQHAHRKSSGPLPSVGRAGEGGRRRELIQVSRVYGTMYRNEEQRDFARRLRSFGTSAERELWRHLRAQRLDGFKFRRQAAIGAYVVDFVCFLHRLAVELDGPQHLEPAHVEADEARTNYLNGEGFKVLRFRNHEVDDDVRLVVDTIRRELEVASNAPQTPSPALPTRGRGPEELV